MDSSLPCRKSVRLATRDYGGDGTYFVTICTHERKCNLSRIGHPIELSKFGKAFERAWQDSLAKRPYIVDRHRVVMPNHVHLLFSICRSREQELARHALPLHGLHAFQHCSPESVATIIGAVKSAVTKTVNELRATPGAKYWQRGYYEHIVRGDDDLFEIAEYIRLNPERWLMDRENPDGQPDRIERGFWTERLRLVGA